MSVITYNSNIYPEPINGAMIQKPAPPKVIVSSSASVPNYGGTGSPQRATIVPEQVIGLVPLFSCCSAKDALAGFSFGSFDTTGCSGATTELTIIIDNVIYGAFSYSSATSNATIQNDINALLSGSGFTCTVTGTALLRFCVITAVGTGDVYNGAVLNVIKTGSTCGGVVKNYDFSGGTASGGFSCDPACDCRSYGGDSTSDDKQFLLPVFATADCTDSYHNGYNLWILKYPGTYDAIAAGDFKLQKLVNGVWSTAATLNSTTYGTPYNNNFYTNNGLCQNVNYCGYEINWRNVLLYQGEGQYRLYVSGYYSGVQNSYCFYSPPFCLRTFDCDDVNGTCKFEAYYAGGNFGSVTKQGNSWSLCCTQTTTNAAGQTIIASVPIKLRDSIWFFGFFGREGYDPTRDSIKYATGEIKKVRDEIIKVFDFETSQMPMWFHQRLASYGFMADQLFVSDYNVNNDSYEYKRFWVVADSDYKPIHRGFTRYPKVRGVKFKEGLQYIFRDRCCSANKVINVPPPPPPPGEDYRAWSDADKHLWSDSTGSAWS